MIMENRIIRRGENCKTAEIILVFRDPEA